MLQTCLASRPVESVIAVAAPRRRRGRGAAHHIQRVPAVSAVVLPGQHRGPAAHLCRLWSTICAQGEGGSGLRVVCWPQGSLTSSSRLWVEHGTVCLARTAAACLRPTNLDWRRQPGGSPVLPFLPASTSAPTACLHDTLSQCGQNSGVILALSFRCQAAVRTKRSRSKRCQGGEAFTGLPCTHQDLHASRQIDPSKLIRTCTKQIQSTGMTVSVEL